MVADDEETGAMGMAKYATVRAWDADNDIEEMTNEVIVGNSITLSNHSYGINAGWSYGDHGDNWYFYGGEYDFEDPTFGNYDDVVTGEIDALVHNAPYYLIVWAVGNDRGEGPPSDNYPHYYYDPIQENWVYSTEYRSKDGGALGYDCIPQEGLAKNILTVGAVDDIPSGYVDTSDVKQLNTKFSSWGPTDDGRIKPDIVANGDNLKSPVYHEDGDESKATGNAYYTELSGTSMAAPNVTGTLILLKEHYLNTHNQSLPTASTLKGLVIHTAHEAGDTPGPDFEFGWGLLNAKKAAEVISLDQTETIAIQEEAIGNGEEKTYIVYADGTEPLKATVIWNDPVRSGPTNPVLVNDLDLRILDENSTTNYPWILNSGFQSNAASTGDNTKDNVEQVFISSPIQGSQYTVKVSHKSSITTQDFTIIITGATSGIPTKSVTLNQKLKDGSQVGNLNLWEGTIFGDDITPGTPMPFNLGSEQVVLGDQGVLSNQKFNNWNNVKSLAQNFQKFDILSTTNEILSNFDLTYSSIAIINGLEGTTASGGNVQFNDPWFVDYADPSYGNNLRNRGDSAVFRTRTSPFYPNLTTTYENNKAYQGVFLEQNLQFNPSLPIYSVKTTSPQPIYIQGKTRQFYFQNWESTGASFKEDGDIETPVVFNQANATVKAVMKGSGLSNNSQTFADNNQRKIVKTDNGNLHRVYESLGKIWYERSTDNGSTWTIMNNNQPISSDEAKLPSIDHGFDGIVIAYQQVSGSLYTIQLKLYQLGSLSASEEVAGSSNYYYSTDAYPVVAYGNAANQILVVWHQESSNPFISSNLQY